MGLVSKYTTSGSQKSYMLYIDSNNRLNFIYDSGGGSVGHSRLSGAISESEIDTWIHLAVTADVSDTSVNGIKFYKNGVLGTSSQVSNGATAIANTTAPLLIGAYDDITDKTFDGEMDDVRIWSDIRTAEEIADNMNEQLVGTETNLVAYYKLNNSLLDETSNNNDLTNNNAATFSEDPVFYLAEPDGSDDTTSTVNVTTAVDYQTDLHEKEAYVTFDLGSEVTKTGLFWVILRPSSFGSMAGSDEFFWFGRVTDPLSTGIAKRYNGTGWFKITGTVDGVTDSDLFDFDLALVQPNNQDWLNEVANNNYHPDKDADIFFVTSDNGFMYMFENNKVHQIDGTLTGGGSGTLKTNVLRFPSYFICVDAVDTRGRMYVAVQSNPVSGSTDSRAYSESTIGVYVWDRQSQVFGTRDFVPLYGVRDIKKIYVDPTTGDVRVICIGDDRFTQIRSITDGQGKILETLGTSAYPEVRDGLKNVNGSTTWLGSDGIFYLHGVINHGDQEGLFKYGDTDSVFNGTLTAGALLVGNEDTIKPETSIIFSFTDGIGDYVKRWLPNAVDSKSDWIISGASYSSESLSVTSQDTDPYSGTFSTDGKHFYIVGFTNGKIFQYDLTEAWDITTATYSGKSFTYTTQDDTMENIFFKPDGTRFYITAGNNFNGTVFQYDLSTPWDISTTTYNNDSFDASTQISTYPGGMAFDSTGTKMLLGNNAGNSSSAIYSYTLTTKWDISTATYDSVSLVTGTQNTRPNGIFFKPDGTRIYVSTFSSSSKIFQYSTSGTPFVLSGFSYDSISKTLSDVAGLEDIVFRPDGSEMFATDSVNNAILKYNLNSTDQVSEVGNVFTPIIPLPTLSVVREITFYMIPGINTGTDVVAYVKVYFNQSKTAWATKEITKDDLVKGWKRIQINQPNVNFIQIEIEFVEQIMGRNDFIPMYAELMYDSEGRVTNRR